MTTSLIAALLVRLAASIASGDIDTDARATLAAQLTKIDEVSDLLDEASRLRLAVLRHLLEDRGISPEAQAANTGPVLMKTWGRQGGGRASSTDAQAANTGPVLMKTWGRPNSGKASADTEKKDAQAANTGPVLMKTWGRPNSGKASADTEKKDA